jgi:alanyl-tRNA synthetase
MASLAQIRSTFLDFFKTRGHEVVASSSLVPRNDPTLMFANSGMVQFKNVFTGAERRPYSRATTAQKCVRAGGKHNDLDNVGYTARHHTFFEMLGNFSFGDYFKPDAIEWAWTLVTKEYGLPADKLTVTVFSEDDEAFDLWKKIAGLPDSRIIRIPTSDNFWSMGDTGPCGPCSEIFYDHGDKIPGGPPGSVEADGDRFIEIWNLVFMQYEQVSRSERINLPKPSIDTGMGLERIAAVLQGTHDNYETDLFRALISNIEETASRLGAPTSGDAQLRAIYQTGSLKVARRVIADHLRATSFLIADGVLPSNEGRGYVLRRIMRRAMRYAHQMGCRDPLMFLLVPELVRQMGAAYPELTRAKDLIEETLLLEETRFKKTLERGLRLLDEGARDLAEGDTFSGETAFKLYDTYGFPLDLTQDALKARGIVVDTDAFAKSMEVQKTEARRAWKGSGDAKTDTIWFEIREAVGATEFLGYEMERAEGIVRAILVNGKEVNSVSAQQNAQIILNQTPFYGESGGQVGDKGRIGVGTLAFFNVTDTQKKLGDLIVHNGQMVLGELHVGDAVVAEVDESSRKGARIHHSSTHLLHEALRRTLGTHVTQKGSLVEPDRLRFDFSHNKPLSVSELGQVQKMANDMVLQNDVVTTSLMSVEAAIEEGAMALFGEKYGEEVRVVSMGRNPEDAVRSIYSLELCGGTHVSRTGDIGLIKILAESGSAAGIRRLEASAGPAARRHLEMQDRLVHDAAAVLKTSPSELMNRLESLMDERKKLERELAEVKKALALGGGTTGTDLDTPTVKGVKFKTVFLNNMDVKVLKGFADEEKAKLGSGIVVIANIGADGKATLTIGVTADRATNNNAVTFAKMASSILGGTGGGGRPEMAQAGGPQSKKIDDAIAAIKEAVVG